MISALVLALVAVATPARPPEWAVPLKLKGAGNLNKVNDSLYRCQQPTREGMRNLADSLRIRTIINLRAFHSDRKLVAGTGMELHELDIKTWKIDDDDVIAALRIIRWSGKGPYLVHCLHGADRTGTVNAMYRMVFQGWTREQALKEMVDGGYGFHSMWKNILDYLAKVDVEKIRAAVEAPPKSGD
jgi:protein tyrosine/serine phosphatase